MARNEVLKKNKSSSKLLNIFGNTFIALHAVLFVAFLLFIYGYRLTMDLWPLLICAGLYLVLCGNDLPFVRDKAKRLEIQQSVKKLGKQPLWRIAGFITVGFGLWGIFWH